MSRDRLRVCLEDGLKLDLNRLARRGFVKPGELSGPTGIAWTSSYWGEVARGLISANMERCSEGEFQIQIDQHVQRIILVARPRHFGGRQWYFICPVMNRRASVLWKPPGASRFCSRETWGASVAYASQFMCRDDRAHRSKSKINLRLCSVGGFNADDWDIPPKPKGMRWRTYNRWLEKFDRYESILDIGILDLVSRLKKRT